MKRTLIKRIQNLSTNIFELSNCNTLKLDSNKTILRKKNKNQLAFKNETNILLNIFHPSIIEILEFNPSNLSFNMPYYNQGNLLDFIKNNYVAELQVKYIMRDLINAIHYCHTNNIIHSDISPENIVLEKQENNIIKPVLIDFENASIVPEICFTKSYLFNFNSRIIMDEYKAPELKNKQITMKSDIYSLGIIFYMLLTGQYAKKLDSGEIRISNDIIFNYNTRFINLIKDMTEPNYLDRPSAEDIIDMDIL